ncbi:hypothetical protein U9M48_038649 [Paspalum notatum var. saurae]|uniref:RNase H type-1 domain-containing protein n=1 Tax=Paspalum notatum var. saurae TaxID=547442 RepID=A0AAQ3UM13_PASNO
MMSHIQRALRWTRSSEGVLKINVDGAFREELKTGGWGFVVRDHRGEAIACGAGYLDHLSTPIHAEAMACFQVLNFAANAAYLVRIDIEISKGVYKISVLWKAIRDLRAPLVDVTRHPPVPAQRADVLAVVTVPVQHHVGMDCGVWKLLPVPVLVALVLRLLHRRLYPHINLLPVNQLAFAITAHVAVVFHYDSEHKGANLEVVIHVQDGLQGLERLPHSGPGLWVLAQAFVRHHSGPFRPSDRVLALHGRVHDPVELVGLLEVGPSPIHQALLPGPPSPIDGPTARQELQQHHPEAVDVALGGQMARHDVLGRRVPVRPHDTCRDVGRVALRPVLGEPEVRQLGVEVLETQKNQIELVGKKDRR